MKIIVSHDVDHLHPSDHVFRDLIFPKLWIRSLFNMLKGKITISTFIQRLFLIFDSRYNRISEVLKKDKENRIPSVFFFGMENGLGLSYKKEKVLKYIEYIKNQGYEVGVHGMNFEDAEKMQLEYRAFTQMSNLSKFGIRMHYVRFNNTTFKKLSNIGYLYDTTEFNKHKLEIKAPYKLGNIWEFPLYIMDVYIMSSEALEEGKKNTIKVIEQAERMGMQYCTILFHDYQYNEKCFPQGKAWYDWLVQYLREHNYEYISYPNAILELEEMI